MRINHVIGAATLGQIHRFDWLAGLDHVPEVVFSLLEPYTPEMIPLVPTASALRSELIIHHKFKGVLMVITHHEEVLEHFDQVVFIDSVDDISKVVAVGGHRDLLRSEPSYQQLFGEDRNKSS